MLFVFMVFILLFLLVLVVFMVFLLFGMFVFIVTIYLYGVAMVISYDALRVDEVQLVFMGDAMGVHVVTRVSMGVVPIALFVVLVVGLGKILVVQWLVRW